MARTGGHKALVPVPDDVWREFRALTIAEGTTIANALADFVTRLVTAARTHGEAAQKPRKAPQSAAKARKRRSAGRKPSPSKRPPRAS